MTRRIALCLSFSVGLVAAIVGPAAATPGQLDPTFGSAGTGLVRTDITPKGDTGWGEVIQPDDKIVAVGGSGGGSSNPKVAVVRYNADGTIDTSFGGGDGIVTVDVSKHQDYASGVGLLSDGTIVAAGGAAMFTSGADFVAVALNGADGSLDTSFGGTGIVRTDINGGSYDVGSSTVVVSSDKTYIGGWTYKAGVGRFSIVSYNGDGTLNAGFGGTGKVSTDVTPAGNEYISALAVDGSGNIVASGVGNANYRDSRAALARYTPAGILDTSFNSTGIVTTNYGPNGDGAFGVAVDGNGKIVTGGGIGFGGSNPRFAVCRYLSTGALDPTFGTGGKVFTDFGPSIDYADIVAIQSTGRIVAAGVGGLRSGNSKFALAGYKS